MSTIDRLSELFERFPGIGPRQARRFVFHLLTEPRPELERLASLIASVKDSVYECPQCFRFHTHTDTAHRCEICSDPTRDRTLLMVVERDSDIRPVERSGAYQGLFFVLGGTVPLMNESETKKLRGGPLKAIVEKRQAEEGLREVILAFSVNPDGENTARYVETLLQGAKERGVTVTTLGRGLSTGSELEYADPETVKNAFRNRA